MTEPRRGIQVPQLLIETLHVDPTIQIRHASHEPTIQRYMDSFENLPPIEVFDTPEGKLVADGFQRLAAARRLGKKRIAAQIHKGTREEAVEFAAIANTRSGVPLTLEERDDGIQQLKRMHPDWTPAQIAKAMSVSPETVRRVFRIDDIKRKYSAARDLPSSHIAEVAKANPTDQEPLVHAARERHWSRDVTRLAVQNLKDARISPDRKQAILNGKADPVVVTTNGQLAVPADVVGKRLRDLKENDIQLQLERGLEQLAKLRLSNPKAIAGSIEHRRMQRLIEELPGYIDFLNGLLSEMKRESRKLAVV